MLLDVNVLLALTWDQHIHHEIAHARFSGLSSWSTCPVTEAGLVRLLLTEKVVGRRVPGREALGQLQAIRQVPGWSFIPDDRSLSDPVIDTRVLMGRRQVTDLQLVNIAAAHNTRLATFDAAVRDSLVPADRRFVEVWS
ncbi:MULTISPECIES: TA system VapC family ribonuclease toxin [Corynebacterium]|jgi:toxin-antitoxin system PIN domain toxin|uniref:TA system VapC family ribonuclease toxin n=1 Tax=Corynebacterium TaxID=1716 RepID=UPI00098F798F|nr:MULTISPECIES: TA system VapC family ribonuclease toxin [Corynebacterium]MCI1255684.1 PIN domain nuclease [Corynebacterium provencense]